MKRAGYIASLLDYASDLRRRRFGDKLERALLFSVWKLCLDEARRVRMSGK